MRLALYYPSRRGRLTKVKMRAGTKRQSKCNNDDTWTVLLTSDTPISSMTSNTLLVLKNLNLSEMSNNIKIISEVETA